MELSACGQIVRRDDNDRYLCTLFAPADRREDLFALYAFNQELAKTREVVSEAMLGRIRLQWWREAVTECFEGNPRRHEVVTPLAESATRHGLPRDLLDGLIDARERDLEDAPPATLDDMIAYCDRTSGVLAELALRILGVTEIEAGRAIGRAWGLIGLLRASAHLARSGRTLLPEDLMRAHGARQRDYRELRDHPELRALAREIAARAAEMLNEARGRRSRAGAAVWLQRRLARAHLKQLEMTEFNLFDPRLAAQSPGRVWTLAARALLGIY